MYKIFLKNTQKSMINAEVKSEMKFITLIDRQ